MAKEFKFVIRIMYEKHDGLIYQIFKHDRKKGFHFILDPRFSVYYKFKELVKSFSIADRFPFETKIEREDDVCFVFRNPDNLEFHEEEHFHTLTDFIAPSASCEFCVFKQEKDDIHFYCSFKKKDLTKEVKNCQYFKQRELFKT